MAERNETSPDEELIRRLRAVDPLADPRFEALADGALGEDEARELREACERGDAPAGAYEAFRPTSAERREAILAAVLESPPARALPIAHRPNSLRGRLLAAGGALAVAAAISLAVVVRSPDPLPAYSLSFEGGATVRSAVPRDEPARSTPVLRLHSGARARLTLVPATAVRGDVAVRAFVAAGREVRPWDASVRVTEQGAIEIDEVRVEGLPALSAPVTDLVLVLGRPREMPAADALTALLAAGAPDPSRPLQVLRLHVVLDAPLP